MRKTQILTWLVVLLVVMNAVTIGTILYHNYQENQTSDSIAINSGQGGNMLNGRFLKQTLGFNDEQMNAFRDANQQFRPFAMNVTDEVDSLKTTMFTELQKAEPDTLRLNEMSKRIGELHGQLKYETYKFYLTIKKICSPEQQTELEKAFQPLFINDGTTAPPNRQRGRGWNRN
jgi:Spy/CpxP family protein refolding chaperone